MRPNMRPKMTELDEYDDVGPNNNDPKLVALCAEVDREKSQAKLQVVLDGMERVEAFLDHESSALMCNTCCRVCYDYITTPHRRAYPDVAGSTICNECL